jgi:dimethylaniline monooxygenase (N-oxide forming)
MPFEHHLTNKLLLQYVHSDRHTVTIEPFQYADRLLRPLHANPSFSALFRKIFTSNPFRALSVLNAAYMSIPSSGQFRLLGEGADQEIAVASILRTAKGARELSKEEKEALRKMREGASVP